MKQFIQINPTDNVVVALQFLEKGTELCVDNKTMILQDDIPVGHKVAIADLCKNAVVLKYGVPIGSSIRNIQQGEHVHTNNIATLLDDNLSYQYDPVLVEIEKPKTTITFKGYKRENGTVGVRNELWIVPTVGCVNGQARQIVSLLQSDVDTSFVDDIVVLSHPLGCSQLGEDHENTKKALASACRHPNAGGVLVLGLGCENNQVEALKEQLHEWNPARTKFLIAQEVEDEVEEGVVLAKQLLDEMRYDERTEQPVSELKIGLKCGGSDGFSGITANPLLGVFSDWLVSRGGSTILTEVPEMFGSESILMNRAVNETVFRKIIEMINGFKDYFRSNNQTIYENPSPGNKAGGISTLEDKSLGCTQKGGKAAVVDVLEYTEPFKVSGLNLLWSPGNDLIASSALALSGCQIVLFTTGRGTPFGSFVPTLKISTNTALFQRKNNWMDFNAGELLESKSMEEMNEELIATICEVANGKKVKHELVNFKELSIFKSGVTL